MAESMTPHDILQREIHQFKTVLEYDSDNALATRARAYQMMRTVEALTYYLTSLVPQEHRESADDLIAYLHKHEMIDEKIAQAVQELTNVSGYFLDVVETDIDFVAEIVDYADTYMQAIEVVFERLQNVNSINHMEDNGEHRNSE